MSYSKLIIKNFGKIKEAEIELSNFILFIGDNNSGKSYLMTLIYGLMKYNHSIANIMLQDKEFIYSLEEYQKIKDIVDKYIKINEKIKNNSIVIDSFLIYKDADKKLNLLKKDEINLFNELLNKLLNKYKIKILRFIFNDDFIVYLKEEDKEKPYFALKVDNTDILIPGDEQ